MGQKIHPIAVRLNLNRNFDSAWFNNNFIQTFKKELLIRKVIQAFFKNIAKTSPSLTLGRIFYQKDHQKTLITLFLYKQLIRSKRKKYQIVKRNASSHNAIIFGSKKINQKLALNTNIVSSFKKNYQSNLTFYSLNKLEKNANINQTHKYQSICERKKFPFLPYYSLMSSSQKCQLNFERFPVTNSVFSAEDTQTSSSLLTRLTYLAFLRSNNTLLNQPKIKAIEANSHVHLNDQTKANLKPISLNSTTNLNPALIQYLENSLSTVFHENIYIRPIMVSDVSKSAVFLAEQIAFLIQKNQKKKKMPMKEIKEIINSCRNVGIRLQCSGRLGGVAMAKKFVMKKGQTSLNVFSKKIDFAQSTALTKYGIIGVKVWIQY